MFAKVLKAIFGDKKEKDIKALLPMVQAINDRFNELQSLSDNDIRQIITDIKAQIKEQITPNEQKLEALTKEYQEVPTERERDLIGIEIDKQKEHIKQLTRDLLDEHLIEVFAVVKDTCRRQLGKEYDILGQPAVWDMVPFDVQLMGGIVLHQGNISEMATGEGKTLVAAMALFLNSLTGRGVHLVTVNDYLVRRDARWMSPIFDFHDISVGTITTAMDPYDRIANYEKDITYGTSSEFGFDYLRDNMAVVPQQLCQRGHFFAIIDEVDSILIDEARTPLIISGPVGESKNFYSELDPLIKQIIAYQNQLIQRMMTEIRTLQKIENPTPEDNDKLGRLLVTVWRGSPQNKALTKLLQEHDIKKMLQDYEGYILRDKTMHEIDNDLFFIIEEKNHTADLCEKGRAVVQKKYDNIFTVEQLEDLLHEVDEQDISDSEKTAQKEKISSDFFDKNEILHNISQLIRAYSLFEKDVDYVVQENKVIIVDQFTGRMMPGRRYSDGLHQALEAKEKVQIEEANQTYATITLQNYFRMYEKLSGMTGTAVTEEGEFYEIYKLPVKVIPTNLPVTRIDHEDVIYMTKNEKYNAIINEIEYWHNLQKPVLVGTVTVETSEILSKLLQRKKIDHKVLNAKYHQQEAQIVANAGQPSSVTIATNMAGRGTDIKLGEGVITRDKTSYLGLQPNISEETPYGEPLDGLHIIGTERHESRRIDRQLRGRAGRQGDPGSSRFYLSLEDDLMRLFGSERIAPLMMKLGLKPSESIQHPWMSKSVESAQKRVEGQNFEIRKQLIKYDEVMNTQREVIYTYRRNVLKGYDVKNDILEMIETYVQNLANEHIGDIKYSEDMPLQKIVSTVNGQLNLKIDVKEFDLDRLNKEIFIETLFEILKNKYDEREKMLGEDVLREIERKSLLSVVDYQWRDHLHEMDVLKEGITFRSYANKEPLTEYKRESYILFEQLIYRVHENTVRKVFNSYIVTNANYQNIMASATLKHEDMSALNQAVQRAAGGAQRATANPAKPANHANPDADTPKMQPVVATPKVGRNDPCPCGSGKKYKKCCGAEVGNRD